MSDLMIKVDNVKKEYRLGAIGGTTLRDEIQRRRAKRRNEEDPTSKIGSKRVEGNEKFMALNGISFEVKKGEAIGIIGHNGAGKSTLLKLITRITAPTTGHIYFNGRIASMLEVGTGFHPELTGRENVYLNGAILGMTKKEIDAKMEEIIEFSEVRQFIDTPVKRYSSGMYVKLAFSVAAHLDSEIMVMDEVLAVGDVDFQNKCIKKMRQVADSGRTILYVSHNMNTIRNLCDKCIVLDKGCKVFEGDVDEAIGIYSGMVDEETVSINYSMVPRKDYLKDTAVRTIFASYVGKKDNYFSDEETMKLKIEWINEKTVRNLCFRVEIKQTDGTPVATAVCYNCYSGDKGAKGMLEFCVDISELITGKYTANYVFFTRDENGNNYDVDCVRGMLLNKEVALDKIQWDQKHWGYVRLPDICCTSL